MDTTPRTLAETLADLADKGYTAQFEVDDDSGEVRCISCDTSVRAKQVGVDAAARVEVASDPADNSLVLAVRCSACGVQGTIVSSYGPEATAGEMQLLEALPADRSAARGADNSARPDISEID